MLQVMTLKDARPVKVGTIQKIGGRIVLNLPEPYKSMMSKVKFEGKFYVPTDIEYTKILPFAFRGNYMWVEPEK